MVEIAEEFVFNEEGPKIFGLIVPEENNGCGHRLKRVEWTFQKAFKFKGRLSTVVLVKEPGQFTDDLAGQEISPESFSRQNGMPLSLFVDDLDENVMALLHTRHGITGESHKSWNLVGFFSIRRKIFEFVEQLQFSQIIRGGLMRLAIGGHTGELWDTVCLGLRSPLNNIELHDDSPKKGGYILRV